MQKIWLPEGKYPKVEILLGNGNVGIGTTGPSSLLDIEASVQNTDFEMTNTYGTTGRNRIQMNISDRSWAIENDGNMNIWKVRDNTASADRLAIDYNGNVGIGTTDPGSYKLHVEGSMIAGSYATGHIIETRISPKEGESFEIGDLLSISEATGSAQATESARFTKSQKAYDQNIIGVAEYNKTDGYKPTIAGVFETKVSTINGSIKAGDPITSSEIPGGRNAFNQSRSDCRQGIGGV